MDCELLTKAYQAVQTGHRYAFATVVSATLKGTPQKAGAKMLVTEDGTIFGTIGGGRNEKAAQEECLKCIKSGTSKLVTYDFFGHKGQSICGGQFDIFIEPNIEKPRLVICGGGHIALPLSVLAKISNFHVTIIDNRKEFASKKRFKHVDQIRLGSYPQMLRKIKDYENTFFMVVTQGNEYDYSCLKTLITKKPSYLGVISSQAKKTKFFKRLKQEGVSAGQVKKVAIPAGLDIGALTPEEIALSIMSEIVKMKNSKNLGTSKFKSKSKN